MALNVHALLKFEENDSKTLPSISSLHLNYGRSLRENVMAEDPFYALSEVFALTTASQKQFLNLVEHKLAEYTNLADSYFDALPNLRYLKQVLLRQRQQIRATRLFIRNAKPPKWAKAVSDVGKRARTAVEQDYSHLGDHAEDLDKRCQEAITVLMSSVAIADSKKAIMQAERVAKLTFLAFIFGPLSFTTSFFGMNFNELSGQSIWEWFVLTTSVLTVTLLFFFCDVSRHWKSCIEYIKDRLR
jgi:Mg2+ and Co2+ transporter CorA